jgi:cupin 2 domain-containing protein
MIEFFSQHNYLLALFLMTMAFLSGFVDAIAGGGGLVSLPALLCTGMPISTVLGTNKLQSGIGNIIAAYSYYKGNLVDISKIKYGVLSTLIGAILGAIVVNYVSNSFMHFVLPILLIVIFIVNIVSKQVGIVLTDAKLSEMNFFIFFGFVLGFYDAFFGPGVGNFWIISIVYFLGYTFMQASGCAKALNLTSTLFALAVFLYYQEVHFIIGIYMSIGQIFGNYLGVNTVIRYGSKFVRPFFIVVISISIITSIYGLIR